MGRCWCICSLRRFAVGGDLLAASSGLSGALLCFAAFIFAPLLGIHEMPRLNPFNPQPLIYHLTNIHRVLYSLVKVLLACPRSVPSFNSNPVCIRARRFPSSHYSLPTTHYPLSTALFFIYL